MQIRVEGETIRMSQQMMAPILQVVYARDIKAAEKTHSQKGY